MSLNWAKNTVQDSAKLRANMERTHRGQTLLLFNNESTPCNSLRKWYSLHDVRNHTAEIAEKSP